MAEKVPCPMSMGFESLALDIPYPEDKVFVDYVMVNNTRLHFNQKTRILAKEPKSIDDLPLWDTSMFNTFEFIDPRPELVLKPVAMFPDPFRKGKNKIVLCELFLKDEVPEVNTRRPFAEFMQNQMIKADEPWVGWEQEFFIVDRNGHPIGWDWSPTFVDNWRHTSLDTGNHSGFERQLTEYHAKACLYAGLEYYGYCREECCGQWEYQIGPGDCLKMADDLVMSRYLLVRVAELFGTHVSFLPKPAPSSIWSSGNHLNFSTNKMREENGIVHVRKAAEQLSKIPVQSLLKNYDRNNGEDNKARLVGDHFVPSQTDFTIGDSDKFASIRIPECVVNAGKGYLEERRPSADCDPYTTLLAFMRALYAPEQLS